MESQLEVVEKNGFEDDDEDTQKDLFFTFRVGNEDYAIEIVYVNEVVGLQRITEVPDMPDFIKGVINLRGKVIPVMDVRVRFRMEARAYDDRTCVVVVNIQDNDIGLVVDHVRDVLEMPQDRVAPPPNVGKASGKRFIKGLGKVDDSVKIILDVQKLLFEEELDHIVSAA